MVYVYSPVLLVAVVVFNTLFMYISTSPNLMIFPCPSTTLPLITTFSPARYAGLSVVTLITDCEMLTVLTDWVSLFR